MHWILTIMLMFDHGVSVTHEEYYSYHNCQEAATVLHNQYKQAQLYGQQSFTCTAADDMSPRYQ